METVATPVTEISIPGLPLFKKGKVRNVFEIEEKLLIVATDRISAFDYVLPNGIPYKGIVLNGLSKYWFNKTSQIIQNHMISTDVDDMPRIPPEYKEKLEGRSMLVRRAEMIEVECVVRGYLAGSAWKEYKKTGTINKQNIQSGYKEADRLDEPIFTPATKAASGHDENIPFSQMEDLIGKELAGKMREASLKIYTYARDSLIENDIILADTKYEFGLYDGELMLIDELMTPDSSRYWVLSEFNPGVSQDGFDKQYVRDYLESIHWEKKPPVPQLPEEVILNTSKKYKEIYTIITGKEL